MEKSKTQKLEFKKRLYDFVLRLVKLVESLKVNQTTRIIGDQLLRSGTSILANYVEAQSGSSKRDYLNFFQHSLKSGNESKVWLALLRDTGHSDKEKTQELLDELAQITNILASSILTMKGKK